MTPFGIASPGFQRQGDTRNGRILEQGRRVIAHPLSPIAAHGRAQDPEARYDEQGRPPILLVDRRRESALVGRRNGRLKEVRPALIILAYSVLHSFCYSPCIDSTIQLTASVEGSEPRRWCVYMRLRRLPSRKIRKPFTQARKDRVKGFRGASWRRDDTGTGTNVFRYSLAGARLRAGAKSKLKEQK